MFGKRACSGRLTRTDRPARPRFRKQDVVQVWPERAVKFQLLLGRDEIDGVLRAHQREHAENEGGTRCEDLHRRHSMRRGDGRNRIRAHEYGVVAALASMDWLPGGNLPSLRRSYGVPRSI